ncbi:MAG: hypothetical protein KKG35_08755 [Proteobacteria bacterium]|nr:hypothetical protein [Pseudomonadota bacterium]
MKMNMMMKIMVVLFVALEILSSAAFAQTSRNEMISDVLISDQSECAIIEIVFALPVKYKKHFPESAGRELRVYLDPITVTADDRELTNRNEYYSPPDSDIVTVSEIIYEGADVVEPYLTILFTHQMKFTVRQGGDFRSLLIPVFLPSSNAECLP